MFTIRTTVARLPGRADARRLATALGRRVAASLARAVRQGIEPTTGAARQRKADGKPVGLDTGRLASGIAASQAAGSSDTARCTITPPTDRASFVERVGDVIVVGGLVDKEIERELDTEARRLVHGR
jgi:hypothetical protein